MPVKISVTIPVYNVAGFLPRCLESVCAAAEKVEGVEVICVDDGSTDGSGAILDEYASRFNSSTSRPCGFKVIHQENGGESRAREAALNASGGDWIASVDADDWVEVDYLKNLLGVAESAKADFIWSDYMTDYGDGRISKVSHECGGGDLDAYILGVLGGAHSGVLWNKLIRRAFVMQNNIHHPDGRIPVCEDLWFTSAVLSCRPRIRFAPGSDYHYCVRKGSAVASPYTHERFVGLVRLQEFLEGLALPEGASEILKKRRKWIKFGVYRNPVVSDGEFYRLYPEVRDMWDYDTPIWHKILFWLAVRGFKPLINRLWK